MVKYFEQKEGIDFKEFFSSFIKEYTIQISLILDTVDNWNM